MLYQTMSNDQGGWIYDARTRSMAWQKPQISPGDLDQTIQKLAAQGLAMLAVAGILLAIREISRAFAEQ